MAAIKENNQSYFITSAYTSRKGNGSDFYLDLLSYFKSRKYKTFNTLKYGHYLLLFYEIYLFLRIPRKSRIITTWVGFPRQLLVFRGRGNMFRAIFFGVVKNWKSWELIIIPIDLPLRQYENSLRTSVKKRVQNSEDYVFSQVDAFLTCGDAMTKEMMRRFPRTECIKFDMYDQFLPVATEDNKTGQDDVKRIVLSGNLNRMTHRINELPKVPGLEYHLTGPLTVRNGSFKRQDIHYHGVLSEQNFVNLLSRMDYGLVLYDKNVENYFSLVISGKVTSYLSASLPIIVLSKYISICKLVKDRNLGIIIDDLGSLQAINKMEIEKYQAWRRNAVKESLRIKSFEHYSEALEKL